MQAQTHGNPVTFVGTPSKIRRVVVKFVGENEPNQTVEFTPNQFDRYRAVRDDLLADGKREGEAHIEALSILLSRGGKTPRIVAAFA